MKNSADFLNKAFKSLDSTIQERMVEKAKRYNPGDVSHRADGDYQKQRDGSWSKVKEQGGSQSTGGSGGKSSAGDSSMSWEEKMAKYDDMSAETPETPKSSGVAGVPDDAPASATGAAADYYKAMRISFENGTLAQNFDAIVAKLENDPNVTRQQKKDFKSYYDIDNTGADWDDDSWLESDDDEYKPPMPAKYENTNLFIEGLDDEGIGEAFRNTGLGDMFDEGIEDGLTAQQSARNILRRDLLDPEQAETLNRHLEEMFPYGPYSD